MKRGVRREGVKGGDERGDRGGGISSDFTNTCQSFTFDNRENKNKKIKIRKKKKKQED